MLKGFNDGKKKTRKQESSVKNSKTEKKVV